MQLEQTYTSWNAERLSRHLMYWMAWLLFYATMNTSAYLKLGFWDWVQIELLIMMVKLPFTYFVIYGLVPRFLIKKQYLNFILIGLVVGIIGGYGIRWIYSDLIRPWFFADVGYGKSTKPIFYYVLDLIYVASLPTILKLFQRNVQQEKRALELAQQKLGAELTILKNQLHPHFLFNTLNNLYGMVLTHHDKAADVVVRLSDMMSYMLYECEQSQIALGKEITNLKNYIELEKIRYGQRLDISFETGGDISDKTIAPLLFIPFVENAFKHSVGKSERNEWVRINLWVNGNELELMIENSLPDKMIPDENDLPKTQSGIGLSNVRKRLELLYPNTHTLEIKQGDTFLVNLKVRISD